LTVNDVRLPCNQLPDQPVAIGGGHPDIGIHSAQRQGTDVVDIPFLVTVTVAGESQNPHIMAVGSQFVIEVFNRGNHAIGGNGIEIGGNQNFHQAFSI
jgi:hypothetical protein